MSGLLVRSWLVLVSCCARSAVLRGWPSMYHLNSWWFVRMRFERDVLYRLSCVPLAVLGCARLLSRSIASRFVLQSLASTYPIVRFCFTIVKSGVPHSMCLASFIAVMLGCRDSMRVCRAGLWVCSDAFRRARFWFMVLMYFRKVVFFFCVFMMIVVYMIWVGEYARAVDPGSSPV